MTTIELQHEKLRDAADEYDGLAIEVRALTKTYPGGVEAVKAIDFDVARRRGLRPARARTAPASRPPIGMLTTTDRPTAGPPCLPATTSHRARSRPDRGERRLPGAGGRPRAHRSPQPRAPRPALGRARPRAPHAHRRARRRASGSASSLDRPVGSYSGGQRRRLEIARALVSEPQVLFLDEPTVGLDPRIRHELLDVIAGLRAAGEMTILLTTHYLDEAERLCDRVGDHARGRDRRARHARPRCSPASAREILELRVDGDAAVALDVHPRARRRGRRRLRRRLDRDDPAPSTPGGRRNRRRARDRHPAATVSARPPTLDDVYLRLTGGSSTDSPDRQAEP